MLFYPYINKYFSSTLIIVLMRFNYYLYLLTRLTNRATNVAAPTADGKRIIGQDEKIYWTKAATRVEGANSRTCRNFLNIWSIANAGLMPRVAVVGL